MDLNQTINAIVTTLVNYFRDFDIKAAGEFIAMIISRFNADTIKTTFSSLGVFLKDIFNMISA